MSEAARAPLAPASESRSASPRQRRSTDSFVALWTLAVFAAASAFIVNLSLRGRTVSLGYELGRVRSEQTRLREVKRVLELEAASYKTPARVETVARTLLGMEQAPPERIISLRAQMPTGDVQNDDGASGKESEAPAPKSDRQAELTGIDARGTDNRGQRP